MEEHERKKTKRSTRQKKLYLLLLDLQPLCSLLLAQEYPLFFRKAIRSKIYWASAPAIIFFLLKNNPKDLTDPSPMALMKLVAVNGFLTPSSLISLGLRFSCFALSLPSRALIFCRMTEHVSYMGIQVSLLSDCVSSSTSRKEPLGSDDSLEDAFFERAALLSAEDFSASGFSAGVVLDFGVAFLGGDAYFQLRFSWWELA